MPELLEVPDIGETSLLLRLEHGGLVHISLLNLRHGLLLLHLLLLHLLLLLGGDSLLLLLELGCVFIIIVKRGRVHDAHEKLSKVGHEEVKQGPDEDEVQDDALGCSRHPIQTQRI